MKEEERRALFWNACIPVRLIIFSVYILMGRLVPQWLPTMALCSGAVSLGFLCMTLLEITGFRRHGAFGGRMWWSQVRWIHIVLWAATALLSFHHVPHAGILLLCDTVIGATAGLLHYGA